MKKRRIDDLERIVIPKKIRQNYNLNEENGMKIFVDANQIVLEKISNQLYFVQER